MGNCCDFRVMSWPGRQFLPELEDFVGVADLKMRIAHSDDRRPSILIPVNLLLRVELILHEVVLDRFDPCAAEPAGIMLTGTAGNGIPSHRNGQIVKQRIDAQ